MLLGNVDSATDSGWINALIDSAGLGTVPLATVFECYSEISVMGKMAIEVMFFDPNGKVSKVIAHYN